MNGPVAVAPRTRHLLLAGDVCLPPLPAPDLAALGALLDDAGLTGRGGSGFPTARKLAAVAAAGREAVVVGNAMEGEPLSHKDLVLLQRNPGLVVDGLALVADALGARTRILAVDRRAPVPVAALTAHPGMVLRRLDGGFVAGQESALVNQLDGRSATPSDPLVPVRERGVGGRPTLVANAETLAQVALLARFGAGWFRSAGTPTDPGTFLATVGSFSPGPVAAPGVLEVDRGAALDSVLARAGTDLAAVSAVLVGGYHGTWVTDLALPVTRDPGGASPGAGVLQVLGRDDCPVARTADVASYLARASARQCGPCVNGLPHLATLLHRLAGPGAHPGLTGELERVGRLVTGRGACAHPDGTARLVASLLTAFPAHVDAHLRGGCPR